MIDDLENCGIRFVYFSPYSESVTKAYGKRLGLETDWNSCIILSPHQPPSAPHPDQAPNIIDPLPASQSFSDPKSKIPRGVHNIRPHLEGVDDIPLHISLFAECDTASVLEMLKIYTEYAEKVISIGSTLDWCNGKVFSNSLLSIGMEPAGLREATSQDRRLSTVQLSAALTSLHCPFVLPFDCSPYVLTEIIREARSLFDIARNVIWYRTCLVFGLVALAVVQGATVAVQDDGPMLIAGFATGMALFNFALFPASPYDPENLKRMPKTLWSREEWGRHVGYFSIRILISVASAATLGLISASSPALLLLGVVLWISAQSASFMHDHLPLWELGRPQGGRWAAVNGPGAGIAIAYFLHSAGWRGWGVGTVARLLKVLLCIASSVALHELVKTRWRVIFEREQKRAKLLFNTKLGMHSPV